LVVSPDEHFLERMRLTHLVDWVAGRWRVTR